MCTLDVEPFKMVLFFTFFYLKSFQDINVNNKSFKIGNILFNCIIPFSVCLQPGLCLLMGSLL